MRVVLVTIIWTIALVVGFISMTNYELTPGAPATPPETWPAVATEMVSPDPALPTLVVFAHPKCPCTRATISELERLMVANHASVKAHVVFLKPTNTPADWAQTDLWNHARTVPGTTVTADDGGRLSEVFQAKTSGTALLYDEKQQLIFRGGLTSSRGHEGSNIGSATITALLNGQRADHKTSPVFGCGLQNGLNKVLKAN